MRNMRDVLTKRDLKMFDLTCEMELPLVADRLDMSLDAVHQRYLWVRKKRKQAQKIVNICNNADKKCSRLKKFLTSSDLKRR